MPCPLFLTIYPGKILRRKKMRRLCLLPAACLTTLLILFNFGLPDTVNSRYPTPPGLNVVRIIPSGTDVPPGRQIVFEFDRAVVPRGRMEREAAEVPVTISPELNCRWRWLNTSALACELDETAALTPATRYDIVVNPGHQDPKTVRPWPNRCSTALSPNAPGFDMPGLKPGRPPACP